MSKNNYHYLCKYIIVGNSSTGKSNLLLKFCKKKFSDEYQATIGVEFDVRNIDYNDKIFRIQLWDTAGQEYYRSITKAYYRSSICAIVVYDITNRESFESVKEWVKELNDASPKTILICLVGNKIDLEEMRVISTNEGKEYAEQNNFYFIETSAKTGVGVEDLFYNSIKIIFDKINKGYYNFDNEICGIKKGDASDLKYKLSFHEINKKKKC